MMHQNRFGASWLPSNPVFSFRTEHLSLCRLSGFLKCILHTQDGILGVPSFQAEKYCCKAPVSSKYPLSQSFLSFCLFLSVFFWLLRVLSLFHSAVSTFVISHPLQKSRVKPVLTLCLCPLLPPVDEIGIDKIAIVSQLLYFFSQTS